MDQALLNALHPFSFVTDTDGKILRVGRSLLRLIPSIMKAESVFSAFSIERSLGSVGSEHVDDLTNQLVVLARRDDPSFRLRGQVVQADTLPSRYIFAVTPAITRLDQIQSMDLLLGDFPLGEPILDFLLFMQQQRAFQDSIESARRELEWENRTSKLLHKIVLETQEAIDPSEAYRTVLTAVCHGLTWEIGHVFVRNQEDPSQICSSQDWFIEDGLEIDFFRRYRKNRPAILAKAFSVDACSLEKFSGSQILLHISFTDDPTLFRALEMSLQWRSPSSREIQ